MRNKHELKEEIDAICLLPRELAELVECKETSYACMTRWLKKQGWPYVLSSSKFPKVSRAFFYAKMIEQSAEGMTTKLEPNFKALKKRAA